MNTNPTNMPPADANPLLDRLAIDYADDMERSTALLDGAGRVPDDIEDAETADKLTDFVGSFTKHDKLLDSHRESEKRPYLENGRTVDGFFGTARDKLAKAKKTLIAKLTAWDKKVEAEERARRMEAERIEREEAERLRVLAAKQAEEAETEPELEKAVVTADVAAAQAADATAARKAAEAKPADLTRSRSTYGGTRSLTTRWVGTIVDRDALDLTPLRAHINSDALQKALNAYVRAGGRDLAGAKIEQQKVSRVSGV